MPEARVARRPYMDSWASETAPDPLAAEKVPAFEVVLVRTGVVLDELVVVEVVEVTAGVVTVAVVLALTPASEQY